MMRVLELKTDLVLLAESCVLAMNSSEFLVKTVVMLEKREDVGLKFCMGGLSVKRRGLFFLSVWSDLFRIRVRINFKWRKEFSASGHKSCRYSRS